MNLLTTCGVILVTVGQFDGPSPSSHPIVDIESAVEQLASSKYETRQKATEWLWSAGEAAIPALQRATQNKNREVRSRASFVLENVLQGIAYDTPRDVLREVQRFRQGDQDEKRLALANLENAYRPRILLGLIKTEEDSRLRHDWWQNLERALQSSLLAGADQDVEATLREAAADEDWTRHWVSHLVSTGRLEAELARLVSETATANSVDHARRLAYLFRAKGELSEARRFAEQVRTPTASDPSNPVRELDLAWEFMLEQRDWPTAASRLKARIDRDPAIVGKDPEALGFAAAYHRLSGNTGGFAQYITMLQQVADESAKSVSDLDPRRQDTEKNLIDQQWYVGKALLLNGQFEEAVRVLRRHHSAFIFEVLTNQQRYREAFEVAGVAYPHGFDRAWFEKVAEETASADDAGRQKFAIALHALRQLYFLGQREEVKQWLVILQRGTLNDAGTIRRRMLVDTAVKLGIRDVAVAVGAVVLEREGNPGMLAGLYPNRQALATVWWEYFREHYGQETLSQTLTRIDQCLLLREPPLEKHEFDLLVSDVENRIPLLVEPKRSDWWHGLAETCLLRGNRAAALRFFEKAAMVSSADALRLGDLHTAEQKWSEAANWYHRASEFDRLKALPLWLYAQAIRKLGREEEGEKLAAIALRLPLAKDESRRELAAGLKERGYREESLRQFELLARTGVPGEQDVIEAAKQIGNATYAQNELRGAECWETMVLCCLRNRWGFGDANGYVQIPFLVHKTRAKGLLKSGRVEEGIRELWASHAVSPVNLELSEELLPELYKTSRAAEAEQLFKSCFNTMKGQCQDFPNCATFHNNLAWLCARNRRELDAARHHAGEALKLDPDNPAYIDTLGEVHFHRGSLEEAIACADRCLKIDPRSKHYQEQLVRFSAAKAGGN